MTKDLKLSPNITAAAIASEGIAPDDIGILLLDMGVIVGMIRSGTRHLIVLQFGGIFAGILVDVCRKIVLKVNANIIECAFCGERSSTDGTSRSKYK